MPQHPDPIIRRAVRVLAMVGEFHRRGYQKLRVMPFMSSSGHAWRCWIGPDTMFYRNHGAYLDGVWVHRRRAVNQSYGVLLHRS